METLYDICGLPFGWIMRLIYYLVDNYALAILIFTIIMKAILFPMSYKQQLNNAKLQRLNPKLKKLQEKYKNDQQKLQEATMKLYEDENVNPSGSCLSMFLQFFILFGVLDVVYKPLSHILQVDDDVIATAWTVVEENFETLAENSDGLREELGILQAFHSDPSLFADALGESLSASLSEFYDNFVLFGINLGETPEFSPDVWNYESIGLFILPFISGVLQLIMTIYSQIQQKKKNPNVQSNGCTNLMLYIMPVFSVVFAFQVPAGVGFYWACSSFFSLIQNIFLNNWFTPERTEKILEKQQKKLEKKYAEGKVSLKDRITGKTKEPTEAEKEREAEIEKKSEMSKSELSRYNQEKIKEAREKMAAKYGDVYEPDPDEDKPNPNTKKKK